MGMAIPTAQEILDAIRTAILARLSGGYVNSYSMPDGRNIQFIRLEELTALEERYAAIVAAQQSGGFTFAGFSNPL